jgi:hypothetical protein
MRTTFSTVLLAAPAVSGSVLPRQEYGSALPASPSTVYVTQFSTIYAESCNAAPPSTALQSIEIINSAMPSGYQQYGYGLPGPGPSSIVPSAGTSAVPVQSGWGWPNTFSVASTIVLPTYSVDTSVAAPLVSSLVVVSSSSAVTPVVSSSASTFVLPTFTYVGTSACHDDFGFIKTTAISHMGWSSFSFELGGS